MEALVDWICEDAERLPVLLICEDLQWADASTLEIIQLLLDRTLTSKALLVFSFRPEFRPAWRLSSPATHIALVRLNADEILELVSKVTVGRSLPEEVLSQIATKTDGVPLFVEELTKMVMESDLLKQVGGAYELARPLPEFAIPTSIQDSLTARLDRVASVREIAQLGAVLGREFSYEMIRATAPFDDETLISGRSAASSLRVFWKGVCTQPANSQTNYRNSPLKRAILCWRSKRTTVLGSRCSIWARPRRHTSISSMPLRSMKRASLRLGCRVE